MSQVIDIPLNAASRFAHIDAMRAFAVLLVVVAHAGLGNFVPGGSGVTIFFSISGFIITYLLLRERDKTGKFSLSGFYSRRLRKIAPPLVLIVIIPSLTLSIFSDIDWLAFLGQVFFIYNWMHIVGHGPILDGSGVVWSLAIEEQFYIVFALIWLGAVRLTYWRIIVTMLAAVAVVYSTLSRVMMAYDTSLGDRIYYGSDTRLDGIALGVLTAVAFHWLQTSDLTNSALARILAHDGALIGALCLYLLSLLIRDDFFRDTIRYSFQSLAACLIILYGLLPGCSLLRRLFYVVSQWRLVTVIGLASYSIYLVHLVLMNWVRDLGDLGLPVPVSVMLMSALGVLSGIILYRCVEVPVQRCDFKLRRDTEPETVTSR